MTAGAAPRLRVGLVCSVGIGPARGGRDTNEDNYLVCRDGTITWREGEGERITPVAQTRDLLLAVADGMGGHEDGEVASAAAVQALYPLYLRTAPPDPEDALRAWLLDAHRRLRARVEVDGRVKMGTTLTVAWIHGARVTWAHVGDSRLYHWRAGELARVTRDQTRAEFARRDNRSLPQAPHHLQQNFIYGSRGLGDDLSVRIDKGVDTGTLTLRPGDRLLLCTDGLTGVLDDAAIADALARMVDPGACAQELTDRAMANRSEDNITVVVLAADGAPPPLAPDPDDWSTEETTLVPV